LEKTDIRKISKTDCLNWGARFYGQTSPIAYNHTVSVLRRVFDIGLEMGVRYDNPAKSVEWVKESSKKLRLPEPHQFEQFLKEIETSGSGFAKRCAEFVRFLAYGGFRIGEATNVCWHDIDFPRNKIIVRGDPQTGLKGRLAGEDRQVPIIPEMRLLLERLRRERPAETLEDRVMQVRECQKAMNRAAKIVGLTRITHHDLRHLFATRCIEAGVDIPTVSRWLGHKDGGALAMRVYGHLRDKHSVEMSQKVRFAESEQDKINQVKAKYSFQWWESQSPLEVFWGQANEETRLVSAEVFQKAAEKALGRTVKPQELGAPQTLVLEFIEHAPKAALIELLKKMPKITSLAA
jgi:integrase